MAFTHFCMAVIYSLWEFCWHGLGSVDPLEGGLTVKQSSHNSCGVKRTVHRPDQAQ